jgi:hypothetical protein
MLMFKELVELLADIHVHENSPIKIAMCLFNINERPMYSPQPLLCLWITASDRDTGELATNPFTFKLKTYQSKDAFVAFVADCVRAAFIHEFEEAFHVGGQRIYDPHLAGRHTLSVLGVRAFDEALYSHSADVSGAISTPTTNQPNHLTFESS